MLRVFKSISLLLAMLWLPATLHCAIEASGLIEHLSLCHADHASQHEKHDHGCPCSASDDHSDSCHVIEGGDYRITNSAPVFSAPLFTALTLIVVAPPVVEQPATISPAHTDAPPELARTWHIAEHRAPAPRAPSCA